MRYVGTLQNHVIITANRLLELGGLTDPGVLEHSCHYHRANSHLIAPGIQLGNYTAMPTAISKHLTLQPLITMGGGGGGGLGEMMVGPP